MSFLVSVGFRWVVSLGKCCLAALCRILWFGGSPRAMLGQVRWSPMAWLRLIVCVVFSFIETWWKLCSFVILPGPCYFKFCELVSHVEM